MILGGITMNSSTVISIHDKEYDLATTLRVAYDVQGKRNHTPYMQVFSEIDEMPLEDQIGILYIAFKIANPDVAKTFTEVMFREYYLDNYTVMDIMGQLKGVISGVLGKDIDQNIDDQGNE